MNQSQMVVSMGIRRFEGEGLLEGVSGFFEFSLISKHDSHVLIGFGMSGIEAKGLLVMLECLSQVALFLMKNPEVIGQIG